MKRFEVIDYPCAAHVGKMTGVLQVRRWIFYPLEEMTKHLKEPVYYLF